MVSAYERDSSALRDQQREGSDEAWEVEDDIDVTQPRTGTETVNPNCPAVHLIPTDGVLRDNPTVPNSIAAMTTSITGPVDEDEHETSYSYIFGFGSIINTETHASWLAAAAASTTTTNTTTSTTTTKTCLDGRPAVLKASLGFQRGWYFRSNTGFTALGVMRCPDDGHDVNGVLFRLPSSMVAAFDRREVGYDRIELPLNGLEFASTATSSTTFTVQPHEQIWIYVPQQEYCLEADVDHPILQSYVDTVLQGCLDWGDNTHDMAQQFIQTTGSWSRFFLNDTPSSRRPWLFRKQYDVIDQLLLESAERTHFSDRRHPEEFSKAFLNHMRGSWSLPPRNKVFTGRDAALGEVHAKLVGQRVAATDQHAGLARLEIVGMGGIGKTSICTEYCYRYFPSYYGLVVWLSAQSAEAITLGYKQLMADTTGVDVKEKSTDDVLAEVKTRLFRSKVPWLLVFDNLEDRTLLDKFLPHGGPYGHVLITTRIIDADNVDDHQVLSLGCFSPTESVALLCRSAGEENIGEDAHLDAAKQLAERLGHLPLALGVAAAYMKRCDVDCSEYLARYEHSERSGAALGHHAVSSSLSLSLDAIKQENAVASEVLFLLAYLGPDQITKPILRALLQAKQQKMDTDNAKVAEAFVPGGDPLLLSYSLVTGAAACSCLLLIGSTRPSLLRQSAGVGLLLVALPSLLYVSKSWRRTSEVLQDNQSPSLPLASPRKRTGSFSTDVFEQTDQVWKILKSYSLLDIKEGKGSMHRLLSQALRMYQDKSERVDSVEICVGAMQQLWKFKPEVVDSWQPASNIFNHVKAVVSHVAAMPGLLTLETAALSREAGIYSAMALNRFEEAQLSLERALAILETGHKKQKKELQISRAACLHELGKVFRYHGSESKAGEALREALKLRSQLSGADLQSRRDVAGTLHELGILEVKNHNLGGAAEFLDQSLRLRKSLQQEAKSEEIEAECAATLHQLAAVQVALKPPSLKKAESLLREALTLNMNIGQRAATLKQLARVAIRNGDVGAAESYLAQALELYEEVFGANKLHINIAAVRFQQGALAYQREQLQDAWDLFSDCLRARHSIYAYSQGVHLEVSTVLHELGCVALAQKRYPEAKNMLNQERLILDELSETLDQHHRLFHIKLTNLTWLKKCAKLLGDDAEVRRINEARATLKAANKKHCENRTIESSPLHRELLSCRLVARQFALATSKTGAIKSSLQAAVFDLAHMIQATPIGPLHKASEEFQRKVSAALAKPDKASILLEACDELRDILREQGVRVNDSIQSKGGCSYRTREQTR